MIVATPNGTYLYYQYHDSIKRNDATETPWFQQYQKGSTSGTSNVYLATALEIPVASDIEPASLYYEGDDIVVVFSNDFEEIAEHVCLGILSNGVTSILSDPQNTIAFTCTNNDVSLGVHTDILWVDPYSSLLEFNKNNYCMNGDNIDGPKITTFNEEQIEKYPYLVEDLKGWTLTTCYSKSTE